MASKKTMVTSQAPHRSDLIDSHIGEEPAHCALSIGPRGSHNILMIAGLSYATAEDTLIFAPAGLFRLGVPA